MCMSCAEYDLFYCGNEAALFVFPAPSPHQLQQQCIAMDELLVLNSQAVEPYFMLVGWLSNMSHHRLTRQHFLCMFAAVYSPTATHSRTVNFGLRCLQTTEAGLPCSPLNEQAQLVTMTGRLFCLMMACSPVTCFPFYLIITLPAIRPMLW